MTALSRTIIVPGGASLAADLRELWTFRELLALFAWRDLKVRYKQTLLGIGWAILQPLGLMGLFALFFGRLAGMPTQGVSRDVFYYAGLVPWMYAAGALATATGSIVERQFLVTKVYFPRILLPVAAVLPGLVDAVVAFGGLVALMLLRGFPITPRLLVLPAALGLAGLTALAAALWLSMLNALYRDVRHLVPFLIQLWLFASPIAYPDTVVPTRWHAWYALNPMATAVGAFRWAVAGTPGPSPADIVASSAVVLAVLVSGFAFFRHLEGTVADVV